jgi:hypothetical protein
LLFLREVVLVLCCFWMTRVQPLPQNRPTLAQLSEFAFAQKHQARAIPRLSAWLNDSITFAQVDRICWFLFLTNDDTQDERAFLEQEHDDRANILATRVVTTGGMMQVLALRLTTLSAVTHDWA